MKRELLIVMIAVMIVALIVVVVEINVDNKVSKEADKLLTIEGIVLEVSETNILINMSGYENGECYLSVSEITEIYMGDNKVHISSIEVGQTVQVMYSGGIEESYPGTINEVIKITVE